MRVLLFIFLFFVSNIGWSQVLTDVAVPQNIDVVHLTAIHWASGMSFYDFDHDGWDDLTFPLENDSVAFFRNINGSFQRLPSFLYSEGLMTELVWVDYDNDGDDDLCAVYNGLGMRMYQNDGAFNFTDVTVSIGIESPPGQAWGVSFADPDADGDLDCYLTYYEQNLPGSNTNKFYENQGDGTFLEMGASWGIDNGYRLTFMGVWFDYDNDDLIDLHVINDRSLSSDALYKNLGNGTFIDRALPEGVLNQGHNPMNSSISDFDNDGNQDIFVTDFNNGQTFAGVPLKNKLYRNQNNGDFIDVATAMNLDTNAFAWGALWVDYNNDGYEDLYVSTSYIPTSVPELSSFFYRNDAGVGFTEINDSINGDIIASSVCPVKGDINNDGFYDVAVLNHDAYSNLLLNSGNNNNYIKITPVFNPSGRQAIGSKVRVYSGGLSQLQTVFCGSGMCAQNSQHMIFGVADATVVDSVVVTFPDGMTASLYNLDVNQSYTIGNPIFVDLSLVPGTDTLAMCLGDSVVVGIPGYNNYLWNTGSTDPTIVVNQPGTYSFTAESSGDSIIQSLPLVVVIETQPTYQEIVVHPACGVSPYGLVNLAWISPNDSLNTIVWSNGDQGLSADSLLAGTYVYTITTLAGCVYSDSIVILPAPEFDVQFVTSPATDLTGGSVQFYAFGGSAPFTYIFNGDTVSSYLDDLTPGNYQMNITDANGCTIDIDFIINDATTAGIAQSDAKRFKVYVSEGYLWMCSSINSTVQEVMLIDMNGKRTSLNKEWLQVSQTCQKIPVELPTGIYQLLIKTSEETSDHQVYIR